MKLYDTTGWTASTFDANSYTTNQTSQREGSRTGLNVDGAKRGLFGESVVGINVGKVDTMREAIRNYVDAIRQHLDGIEPLADANNAFRSEEVQKSVQNYINTVKTYCMNFTSQLLAFSDKLGDVKKAYQQNMQSLSSSINSTTSAFDAGTQYKETIQ